MNDVESRLVHPGGHPEEGGATADVRGRPNGMVLAQAAFVAGLVFAAVNFYWGLGGTWMLDTVSASLAEKTAAGEANLLVAAWIPATLKLLAATVPILALHRLTRSSWDRAVRVLAWLEAGILTLYGLVLTTAGLLVQADILHASTDADQRGLLWHAYLWDPWFLIWGLLVAAALLRSRHLRSPPPTGRGPRFAGGSTDSHRRAASAGAIVSKPHHRHSVRRAVGVLALLAVLSSCAKSPGNAETDRIADTVARAISSPRQSSANGFVRAALATNAGQASRLTVIEAEELHANRVADPLARLVFQVHLAASRAGFSATEPITACYKVLFNYYGVIDSPQRIRCPSGATAVIPTPDPPQPHAVIPQNFDSTLTGLLAALPATPTAEEIAASVNGGLPAPEVDPNTGLRNLLPTVEASTNGSNVGVSLWAPFNRDCLLGARIDGQIKIGRPSRTRIEPGELSCDPQTALHLLGAAKTP